MTMAINDSSQVIIVNPEYASLVQPISESEYQNIKQTIKDSGQHVPIIINQKGEILDGHTRFKVTSCLSSCEDCTGIYKDVTNFIKLGCHCPCHSTKKRSLVVWLAQ
jgi:hypothetical protein